MHRIDRNGLGRDADDRRTGRDVPGHDGVRADPRAFADLDRPKHLRAGSNHNAVAQRGMPLSADALSWVRAAKSNALIDGDLVADLGGLADDAEAVIEEEVPSDLGPWMNVDPGQEPREMVYQARDEIEMPFPEPVREPVHPERKHAGIEEHVPARTRRRIAGFNGVQIGDQPGLQLRPPWSARGNLSAVGRK